MPPQVHCTAVTRPQPDGSLDGAILAHDTAKELEPDEPPNAREQHGLPIFLKLTEGQAHDGRAACDMLGSLAAANILLADRAYDSDALRQTLAERGAWANVKPMPNRRNVPAFSSFLYRYRNLVERFFNKLKHFRAVATRYDKTPENYLASVKLASTRIWMRVNESMT